MLVSPSIVDLALLFFTLNLRFLILGHRRSVKHRFPPLSVHIPYTYVAYMHFPGEKEP